MNEPRHELIVRDKGLPTQRIALRSAIPDPAAPRYMMPEYIYQESALPIDISDHLTILMDVHDRELGKACGERWINFHDEVMP